MVGLRRAIPPNNAAPPGLAAAGGTLCGIALGPTKREAEVRQTSGPVLGDAVAVRNSHEPTDACNLGRGRWALMPALSTVPTAGKNARAPLGLMPIPTSQEV